MFNKVGFDDQWVNHQVEEGYHIIGVYGNLGTVRSINNFGFIAVRYD